MRCTEHRRRDRAAARRLWILQGANIVGGSVMSGQSSGSTSASC